MPSRDRLAAIDWTTYTVIIPAPSSANAHIRAQGRGSCRSLGDGMMTLAKSNDSAPQTSSNRVG